MSMKLEAKQSFNRFNTIQKIASLFFIITAILCFGILYFMNDVKLFALSLVIASTVTFSIFNLTNSNYPYVFTKKSLEKFHLLGEANFYIVEKTFKVKSLFDIKFRMRNLLLIREYRQDGSLFTETPYKNSKIWGEVKTYAVDGKLRKSATYYEGDIEGKRLELDGNAVAKENNYKGALLHGLSKSYDKDTGFLISEEQYHYGAHHGKSTFYNSKTSKKISEEFYKNGKKHGVFKYYDEEENLIKTIEYRSDMIHGFHKEFYAYGNEKCVIEYDKDKKNGSFKEFYENGTLKTECKYREDKKNGPHLAYYKSGAIMTRNFYEMDKKKGEAIFYDPDGQPVK